MFGVTLRMKGVPELLATLQNLDKKAARQGLRAAVDAATKPVLKSAKANVPVETSTLKRSLGRKVKPYRNSLTVVGIVGPRKDKQGKDKNGKHRRLVHISSGGRKHWRDPVKYAHLVEFGTRPHSLAKGDRIARKDGKRSGSVRQTQGARHHPGTSAQPFLRPALDANRRNCKGIMKRVLRDHIRKARR